MMTSKIKNYKKIVKNILLTVLYISVSCFPLKSKELTEKEKKTADFLKQKGIKQSSIDYYIKSDRVPLFNSEKKVLLEKAVKEDERNDLAQMALGGWWYYSSERVSNRDIKKYRLKNALKYYKKVNELTGTPISFGSIGKTYYYMEEYEEAQKIFDRMVEELPRASLGYYGQALLALSDKKYEKALENLLKTEKLYEEDKGWGTVELSRVKILKIFINARLNRYEKAFESFYEGYPEMVNELSDEYLDGLVESIKIINENIKTTHPNLYRDNIRKFRELDILN